MPIIVRQMPGERATIDGALTLAGPDTWYWGIEVRGTRDTPRAEGNDCATVVGPRPEEMKAICASLLDRSAPEEFDDTYIPPILRDHVREACELTEASPAIIYGTALSCLGAHAGIKLSINTESLKRG